MQYKPVDRGLYFEEGIRKEVLKAWQLSRPQFNKLFKIDFREEMYPELDPIPAFKNWPSDWDDLEELKKRLYPDNKSRMPDHFKRQLKKWNDRDYPIFLRVHRGFFLTMGVYKNQRFLEVMQLLMENPKFVKEYLNIQGNFAAALADNIINQVTVDAVIFSEPIGSNFGALISPQMYEEFILESYLPLLRICAKHKIHTKIFLTYANASVLIPSILKYGINCLWACEVNSDAMDYTTLREKHGTDLRLIGGIDLDLLLKDKDSIKNEILNKVPLLLEQGGYIPLADGRVRPHVPFENYKYYRDLLNELIQKNN